MKQIIYILTLLILTSCGQSSSEKGKNISTDTIQKNLKSEMTESNKSRNSTKQIDKQNQALRYEFKSATAFKLTDTIFADFNGDRKVDQAVYKRENQTSGIIITHGQTNEEIRIGFGELFAHLTDFNWVDFWGLVKDSKTHEVLIEDSGIVGDREVVLDNPSIVLKEEEAGGGLITFMNGKYVWIHQSD